MFKNFSLSYFNFFAMVVIAILFSFDAFSSSKNIHIKCKNKLTDKLLYSMNYDEKKRCLKSIIRPDKSLVENGNYLLNCTNHGLKLKMIKVCKLLRDNGSINSSHKQFINIPKFNANEGIAYKYTIPFCQYGANKAILKANYIVRDNIISIRVQDKLGHSKFNINMEDLSAGYEEKRNYKCVIDF